MPLRVNRLWALNGYIEVICQCFWVVSLHGLPLTISLACKIIEWDLKDDHHIFVSCMQQDIILAAAKISKQNIRCCLSARCVLAACHQPPWRCVHVVCHQPPWGCVHVVCHQPPWGCVHVTSSIIYNVFVLALSHVTRHKHGVFLTCNLRQY